MLLSNHRIKKLTIVSAFVIKTEGRYMKHKIPSDIKNSDIIYCINEYVRIELYKQMLKDKWFGYLTIEEISGKYHISETSVKKIIYGVGDEVILKASELSKGLKQV